jgi:GNAT superfamily N-acetyltransferase
MRQIIQADAPELARLIHAVWEDDNPDAERIARVILESNRVTLVEEADGRLVGFVDAFSTAAQDGTLRWEVDLLGVHPNYRNRGIAQALVQEVVKAGCKLGAKAARALVKIDNHASLTTFRRCGFTQDDAVYLLYVSSAQAADISPVSPDTHLVSVATLTYSGIWIEGEVTLEALRCARNALARFGWDVAGVILPQCAAAPPDFERVTAFRWLRLPL